MKKSWIKLISFFAVVNILFVANVNALTAADELAKKINDIKITLNNMKFNDINDVINDSNYESLKDTKEIEVILNDSVINSNKAVEEITMMNNHIMKAKQLNEELLNLKDLSLYGSIVEEIKANVYAANVYLEKAKGSSLSGQEEYSSAENKYNDLKMLLEQKQKEAEKRINDGIKGTEIELDIINKHLSELAKIKKTLKSSYDTINSAYLLAKKDAEVANKNLKLEIKKIKEYVNINGGKDLNKLIEANTKMLISGALYGSSELALKTVDYLISQVNNEIESLNNDLNILYGKLKSYEEVIEEKQLIYDTKNDEVNTIRKELNDFGSVKSHEDRLSNEQSELEKLKNSLNNYDESVNQCNIYLNDLNNAIKTNNSKDIVKLLLSNEVDTYKNMNITTSFENKFDINYNWTNYVKVEEDSTLYSYEKKENNVSIYKQEIVPDHEVTDIKENFSLTRYYALIDNQKFDVIAISNNISANNYKLEFDNNRSKWIALKYEQNNQCGTFLGISKYCFIEKNKDVKVFEKEYVKKSSDIAITSSEVAKTRCDQIIKGKDSIEKAIKEKEILIQEIKGKLEEAKKIQAKLDSKNKELESSLNDLKNAKENYEDAKLSLVNSKGQTIKDLESKIEKLNEKINKKPNLDDVGKITEIMQNITSSKVDIKSLLEDINNLDLGLNTKKNLLVIINNILKDAYDKDVEKLKELVGDNYLLVSKELEVLAKLIKESTIKNAKLIEKKAKLEAVNKVLNETINLEKNFNNKKEISENNLKLLIELKDNNNLEFLNDLEKKLQEAFNKLITIDNEEFTLEINKVEIPNIPEVPDTENPKSEENNQNITSNNISYLGNNQVKIDDIDLKEDIKEVIKKQNKTKKDMNLKNESFLNNLVNKVKKVNIIWFLPFLFIIVLILFKRKINEEKEDTI